MKKTSSNAEAGTIEELPPKHRILLLDDHSILRQGLKEMIDRQPDIEVCGEAGDARSGLDMVEQTHPDLVLVDISLPGPNGLEFLKNLKSRYPGIPAAVLSMHDESLYAERALRAGALAYISKNECAADVLEAIRCALRGEIHVSSLIGDDIFKRFLGGRGAGQIFSKIDLGGVFPVPINVEPVAGEGRSDCQDIFNPLVGPEHA